MKRKNYIIILFTLIFTISTTGLPLALHYCDLMKSTSFDSCSVCIADIETPSCCSYNAEGTNFSPEKKSDCCETVLIAQPIDDDYIVLKAELPNLQFDNQLSFSEKTFENEFSNTSLVYSASHSPPLPAEDILILNSVFLI